MPGGTIRLWVGVYNIIDGLLLIDLCNFDLIAIMIIVDNEMIAYAIICTLCSYTLDIYSVSGLFSLDIVAVYYLLSYRHYHRAVPFVQVRTSARGRGVARSI